MLILETTKIPATKVELIEVVDRSIRKWIQISTAAQLIEATGELPNLAHAAVTLSGGTAVTSAGIPSYEFKPATETGPSIAAVQVIANPLKVDGVELNFNLAASNLTFGYARSDSGRLVVTLESAETGELCIQLTKENLDAAILTTARTIAASSGVSILKVDSTLTSISQRELDIKLNVTAKKFVTAVIRVSGRLSLDDQLNATATNLKAVGDGIVAAIAVGFIRPHLDQLQGKSMSLLHLSLGKVQLHDVTVNTANGLQITADFGAPHES